MSKINSKSNVTDLRHDLLDAFGEMRAGKIDAVVFKELANMAGKVYKSVDVQLKYAELRKETPEIPFVK